MPTGASLIDLRSKVASLAAVASSRDGRERGPLLDHIPSASPASLVQAIIGRTNVRLLEIHARPGADCRERASEGPNSSRLPGVEKISNWDPLFSFGAAAIEKLSYTYHLAILRTHPRHARQHDHARGPPARAEPLQIPVHSITQFLFKAPLRLPT
jgi:hypothetical protein